MTENVFEISVNEKTKGLIIRMYKWGLFLFVSALVITIGTLILGYIEYNAYKNIFTNYPQPAKVQTYIHWIHTLIYTVLLPLQGFFVFQFISNSKKALAYHDAEGFNQSFSWFAKQLITASVIEVINILMLVLYIYFSLQLAKIIQGTELS
jgi:hypothetical protein